MTDYGRVKSIMRPEAVEMTPDMVFVASNITPYTEEMNDQTESGFEYNYKAYTKDEYIQHLTQENTNNIDMLMGCVLEMSEIVYQ